MKSVFDMFATLNLDDDNFVKGVKNAEGGTESLSAKTIAMGQVMADAFEAVIRKVAEYGKKIVEVGAQQEEALAKVSTIMDKTVTSTEEMNQAIKNLSSDMGISVQELSDTVYNAISATGDTENAVTLAEKASKLATAGFTDTSSALAVLTTAMNAYGLSAEEATDISDSLIMVQNLGVTTVSELASSMGKAIASASAYGVDLNNLESAYVSITKAGINTAEGTTYISSMMKELGDTGSSVSKVLKSKTGKAFNELLNTVNPVTNELYSLGDVLGILYESVDQDSTALMNLWGSAEAGKASSAIVGQGLEEFNNNLKTIAGTAGATEEAYATMADTLNHSVSVFKTTGENFMSALYNGMSGKLGSIVNFGTEIIKGLSDDFQNNGIGALLFNVSDAFYMIIDKILEHTPEVVSVGLDMIVALADGMYEYSSVITDSAMNIIQVLIDGLIENAPYLVQDAMLIISDLASGIGQALPTLIPAVTDVVLTIFDTLVDPHNVGWMIEGAITLIKGLAQGLINALPILIERAPAIIQSIVDVLVENIPLLVMTAFDLIVAISKALIENLPLLLDAGKKIVESIVKGILALRSKLKETGKEIIDTIKEVIKEKIEEAKTWGKDLMDNFIGGIKAKIQALKDTVKNVAQTVKDFLGFSEPKEGPLSNFHTYAPDMMDLFAKGIRDNESIVRNQINKSFDFGSVGSISSNNISGGTFDQESLTEAFTEALSTLKFEWDDRNLGRMVNAYAR